LGGNSRTTLVMCLSPSAVNVQETLSTLRFGARAKRMARPSLNEYTMLATSSTTL
jgi:kinesin family protein 5